MGRPRGAGGSGHLWVGHAKGAHDSAMIEDVTLRMAMKKQASPNLVGIVGVRARLGGWPLSTIGMSPTSRSLQFDVRDGSYGVELAIPACDHHAVMVALASSRQFAFKTDRLSREVACRAGDLVFVSAGTSARLTGGIPPMLRIGVEPNRVQPSGFMSEALKNEDSQTGSLLRDNDLLAQYMGGSILEELRKPEADRRLTLLHHLGEALAVHFVTHYGIRGASEQTGETGDREAIRRLLEELRLTTHDFPDLPTLADQVGLSRFHFIRVFKAETGTTPARFVELCKVDQAKAMIEAAELSLGDIGDRLGFADQSHLTRRFKSIVGVTPAAYARAHARRRVTG